MKNVDLDKIKKEKPIKELLNFCVFNIDKPSGPTSFWVDVFVKNNLELNKTSHTGTLDPKVTGVLPVLCGRACKLLGWFLGSKKTYVGVMRIHKDIEENKLKQEMKKFTGKIMQLPPIKSRVKRQIREREVFSFNLIEKNGQDILFEADVEAGTYIRKICDDLGKNINGAHMSELRRTRAGKFSEEDNNFVNLYDFEKAVEAWKAGDESLLRKIVIPGEIISQILPVIQINKQIIKALYTGKKLDIKQTNLDKFKLGEVYAGFCKNKFIGVYKSLSETLAKPEFVCN